MELFSYIPSQSVHCWYIEKLLFLKSILYPATLLKQFMVSRSFGVEFFRSLKYKIILSVNRDCLTTSLSICIPLFLILALFLWLEFQDYVE
jgi:hypothetical protein